MLPLNSTPVLVCDCSTVKCQYMRNSHYGLTKGSDYLQSELSFSSTLELVLQIFHLTTGSWNQHIINPVGKASCEKERSHLRDNVIAFGMMTALRNEWIWKDLIRYTTLAKLGVMGFHSWFARQENAATQMQLPPPVLIGVDLWMTVGYWIWNWKEIKESR